MFDPYAHSLVPKKIEIVPAVMPKDFKDLTAHAELVAGAVKRVQIDIVDGVYAHGSFLHKSTWPYHDTASFQKIVSQEHGLPHWDTLNYEFDLMVASPAAVVMDYVHAGASHITVHARSNGSVHAIQQLVDLREEGGAFSVQVGIALMCDAQPDELEPFEAQYDYIQVMGVATIGRQGEPFDPRALHLLERLHNRYPELSLQIDGGVKASTIPALVKAGAQSLVAGSAIFAASDPAQAATELTMLANSK